jgi:hypothetical protein
MRHPNELEVSPLDAESVVEPFDCGEGELNGFLIHQAKGYQSERLAVTHLARYGGELAAYFSLLNDKVVFEVRTVNATQVTRH